MADENTIGVKAALDTADFEAGTKRLDAMIASLEKNLDSFEKKQEDNARKSADAANKAADAQDKANKKISDSADAHAKKQSQAMDRTVGKFRSAAFLIAGIAATAVLAYKKLDDAAKELGDTEAMAQFEAMDTSLKALEDTVLAAGLEFVKTSGLIEAFTSIIKTATQAVTLAAGGIAFLAEMKNQLSATSTAGLGIEDFGKPENFAKAQAQVNTLDQMIENARKKANAVMLATVTAPERSKEATAQAEAEKEYKKAQDKKAKDLEDYIAKTHDLTIKSGESILEAEKDYHAKSAEAWQSYMEKVADITASGIEKRAELARDYSDKITAAELDYQRGVEDAQYNHGQKLVDIERDYQRAIRDAQQTYQEDALEAVRNLDAIGLLRAKEKRDKDLAAARTSRDEANAAESENYSRQLYEAQRALEDKRREAELAYQRGLEDQRVAEQKAMQEAKNTYNQQVADAAQGFADKQAAIDQAYRNENAAAAAQYGYAESAYRNHLVAMRNILAQYGIGTTGTGGGGGGGIRGRQYGGMDVVSSPTTFRVGEAGPEMVYVAPLGRQIQAPVSQTINHTGDFSHSINAAISSSVAGLDGRIVAVVRKAIAEVIR